MPIIRIQAIRTEGLDVPALLRDSSEAVAKAFTLEAAQCWSCFNEIQPGEYFEGGTFRDETARHSPLVTITAYTGRSPDEIGAALASVADAVVSHFGFERGDVFVEFHELAKGTVHTGGEVR